MMEWRLDKALKRIGKLGKGGIWQRTRPVLPATASENYIENYIATAPQPPEA